jgi:hypothetical protein
MSREVKYSVACMILEEVSLALFDIEDLFKL